MGRVYLSAAREVSSGCSFSTSAKPPRRRDCGRKNKAVETYVASKVRPSVYRTAPFIGLSSSSEHGGGYTSTKAHVKTVTGFLVRMHKSLCSTRSRNLAETPTETHTIPNHHKGAHSR
ncbi:hypothetical protein ACJJTC_001947 [Scirpophaga incertulas]